MAVDSPLVGHKVQVESVGVLGIPYRLATRNMKIYHSAQLTLFPTNYDTLDHYIKNVVDFHGYKLDVVYFDFTGKKYLINSCMTCTNYIGRYMVTDHKTLIRRGFC